MRKCEYRNCKNEFIGRSNKKFCCIKCKRNEAKYRNRIKNKLTKENNEY